MHKIAIHGSCVTRDFAEFCGWEVLHYQARSSMCSKTGLKTEYDENFLENIPSKFQRRMVQWDLESRSFSANNADAIIIDLIDERFDVFTHGNTISTRSQAYHKSNVLSTIQGHKKRVERGSEEHFQLFEKGVKNFAEYIDAPVILHNARWAITYLEHGEKKQFERELFHKENNHLLDKQTQILLENIPFTSIVSAPKLQVADRNHKWGLAPFHYIPEYYDSISNQIDISIRSLT